ncbi:MAG: methyltransferase domain-containing protein [Clostridia bacterium]|nr:methyltransferase domain-containing protein [Clostridia bacterium]
MTTVKGMEWTNDTEKYGALIPDYPAELYADLLDKVQLTEESRALEIGIGYAQATLPIALTGCALTAIDADGAVAAASKEALAAYPNVTVQTAKFEETEGEGVYDLIYSGTTFHEIPQAIGYEKAFAMLKSGGTFVRFAKHAYKDVPRVKLAAALQTLYAIYLPKVGTPRPFTEARTKARAELALKYGFTDISYKRYFRATTYTAEEYVAYLSKDEDHMSMEENKRKHFFGELVKLINRFGGKITVYDTIDIEYAKKP